MFSEFPLLSLLIWLPIVGGVICLFFSRASESCLKSLGLGVSVLELALCIPLVKAFESGHWRMQWVENRLWLPDLNIQYALGVDGLSLPLLVLSALITVLVMMSAWHSIKTRVAEYIAAFLILQGIMSGVFLATDAVLFYVFWEALLIPMFLIIGIWGGKNRVYATMKFFLYTFLGSILLLVAILYCRGVAQTIGFTGTDTFSILTYHLLPLSLSEQKWLFLAFLLAFAVKIPMWPVHTWLPDAHVEAPTGGSMILAAILLKMGGYGMVRFLLPIVPDAARFYAHAMIVLSLVAIVYIGLVAIVQQDMKKLIAYSSVSHMGFVTLGFFVGTLLGLEGAMVQMISHGFISAALFFCVGVLYDRMHSREIKDYGGVVSSMPLFATFFVLFAMANVGLPGTSGFVGEFFVILGTLKVHFGFAWLAGLTLVLGAAYTLWMTKRVVFGEVRSTAVAQLGDLNAMEKGVLGILAFLVLCFGVWPAPLLNTMQVSIQHLSEQVLISKLSVQ